DHGPPPRTLSRGAGPFPPYQRTARLVRQPDRRSRISSAGPRPRPSSQLQPVQAALTLRGSNLSGTLSSPEPLMSSPGSVTVWIAELRAGDARAAQRLWQGYFRRLGGVARHKLRGPPPAAADEGGAGRRAPRSVC